MRYIFLFHVCISTLIFKNVALDSACELFLKPCRVTDPLLKQCWLRKIEGLRLYLIRGIPELLIPSIDPLLIPKLSVGKRKSSAASYEAQYRNIVYTGARQFDIRDISVDTNVLVFKLKIFLPALHVHASYNITNGTILGFHVDGSGSSEGSFSNVWFDIILDGERYTRNDQGHIRWREGSIEISYENLRVQVYDIIKDPTELRLFNQFFNKHANNDLRGALTSLLDKTLGNSVIEIINRVYEAFPENSFYPLY